MRLIDERGKPRIGLFKEPVSELNVRDFIYRGPFGRKQSFLKKYFRYNRFQFVGAMSPELVVGAALVDARQIGAAFCWFYQPTTGRTRSYSFKRLLARGIEIPGTPEQGTARFRAGKTRFEFENHPTGRVARIRIGQEVDLHMTLGEGDINMEPLRLCTRTGRTGWTFTRKAAGVPVRGAVRCPLGSFELGRLETLGLSDWSAGFMRHETFWNWAAFAGRAVNGRTVGLNAACGVNETGYTENCFWLDGEAYKLDTVTFDYDPDDLYRPWSVRSTDGTLDLEFHPENDYRERTNALFLASNFHQIVGRYTGTLKASTWRTVRVKDVYGFAEDHYAKW